MLFSLCNNGRGLIAWIEYGDPTFVSGYTGGLLDALSGEITWGEFVAGQAMNAGPGGKKGNVKANAQPNMQVNVGGGQGGGNVVNFNGVQPNVNKVDGILAPNSGNYSRPSGFRKGVRDDAWENAREGSTGQVRDPVTGRFMSTDKPWDMGHKPGHEFRKHAKDAQERGITRKEFLDEPNNPNNFRPELPSSNRSHRGEDLTDEFLGGG